MDVVEHLEDCFAFLRQARQKGSVKICQIPLESYVSATLRGVNSWDTLGHLHLFTMETALKTLKQAGYDICDWMLIEDAVGSPVKHLQTRLMNLLRSSLALANAALTARLLGGYSILILGR